MSPDVELFPSSWFVETRRLLSAYWESTPWHEGGDFAVKRIEKSLTTYARHFRELPRDLIPAAMDQYLAAIWHAQENNRARTRGKEEERFGGKPWLFTAFFMDEDLGDHRYRCVSEAGKVIHFYSESLSKNLKEGARMILALLLEVGEGWWMSYGPHYGWNGLLPGDLDYFASRVARQRHSAEGFDSVLRADPVPFWAAWRYGSKPFVMHGPGAVLSTWMEGRLDPAFGAELPRTWRREDAGKKTRWLQGEDFFRRKEIYLNRSSGEALLYARTDADLDKARKAAGAAFVAKAPRERCGILMELIVKDLLGQSSPIYAWERSFGCSGRDPE